MNEFETQSNTQTVDLTRGAGDGRAWWRTFGPVHNSQVVSVREVKITRRVHCHANWVVQCRWRWARCSTRLTSNGDSNGRSATPPLDSIISWVDDEQWHVRVEQQGIWVLQLISSWARHVPDAWPATQVPVEFQRNTGVMATIIQVDIDFEESSACCLTCLRGGDGCGRHCTWTMKKVLA